MAPDGSPLQKSSNSEPPRWAMPSGCEGVGPPVPDIPVPPPESALAAASVALPASTELPASAVVITPASLTQLLARLVPAPLSVGVAGGKPALLGRKRFLRTMRLAV